MRKTLGAICAILSLSLLVVSCSKKNETINPKSAAQNHSAAKQVKVGAWSITAVQGSAGWEDVEDPFSGIYAYSRFTGCSKGPGTCIAKVSLGHPVAVSDPNNLESYKDLPFDETTTDSRNGYIIVAEDSYTFLYKDDGHNNDFFSDPQHIHMGAVPLTWDDSDTPSERIKDVELQGVIHTLEQSRFISITVPASYIENVIVKN